jgi:hypothetical protein
MLSAVNFDFPRLETAIGLPARRSAAALKKGIANTF